MVKKSNHKPKTARQPTQRVASPAEINIAEVQPVGRLQGLLSRPRWPIETDGQMFERFAAETTGPERVEELRAHCRAEFLACWDAAILNCDEMLIDAEDDEGADKHWIEAAKKWRRKMVRDRRDMLRRIASQEFGQMLEARLRDAVEDLRKERAGEHVDKTPVDPAIYITPIDIVNASISRINATARDLQVLSRRGGRKPKWTALLTMHDNMKGKDPTLTLEAIVSAYRQRSHKTKEEVTARTLQLALRSRKAREIRRSLGPI